MSYRTDKLLIDGHTDTHTYTHTHAGNDNTRRPKLASGNDYVLLTIGPSVLSFSSILIAMQQFSFKKMYLKMSSAMSQYVNSYDARDRIFQLIWSIPCLLMPWLLKSPGHQQAWYWQYKIGNMYSCSIVNLVFFCRTKSNIWYKMWL